MTTRGINGISPDGPEAILTMLPSGSRFEIAGIAS